MDRWEYKHICLNNYDISLLDEYGKEGWELVAVMESDRATKVFYLKRMLAK